MPANMWCMSSGAATAGCAVFKCAPWLAAARALAEHPLCRLPLGLAHGCGSVGRSDGGVGRWKDRLIVEGNGYGDKTIMDPKLYNPIACQVRPCAQHGRARSLAPEPRHSLPRRRRRGGC